MKGIRLKLRSVLEQPIKNVNSFPYTTSTLKGTVEALSHSLDYEHNSAIAV